MLLEAVAAAPGAPGDRPSLTYSVVACGDEPFSGVLLLGGEARLDEIVVTDQHNITNEDHAASAPRVATVPNLALGYEDTVWNLGPAQEIPIVIDDPTPCVGPSDDGGGLAAGSGTTASGLAQGPIQRAANILGIKGPHTSQVWPLVGGFPRVPEGMLGLFTGVDGVKGEWSIPVMHKRIVSGNLNARAVVDGAIPPLADASKLIWDSNTPFGATARVTNIDELDRWQSWLMGGGILLGVGASLMASLLFEWLRPPDRGSHLVQSKPTPVRFSITTDQKHLPAPVKRPANAAIVIASIAVIAWVFRRTRV